MRGEPTRFIAHHHEKMAPSGTRSPQWKGGSPKHSAGYARATAKGHPRADKYGYVLEHVLIAERALGRGLPPESEVHHINEDKGDNRPSNLVVCQDRAYHMLLHKRKRALEACGDPSFIRCPYCKKHGDPESMYVRTGGLGHHRECDNSYQRVRKARARAAK